MKCIILPAVALSLLATGCSIPTSQTAGTSGTNATPAVVEYPSIGSVERLSPKMDELIPPDAKIEMLAEGFNWSEGPVWVKQGGGYLLFSDVPENVVFKWQEGIGARPFLDPSGYTRPEPRPGEMGSNGLTLDRQGRLVLAQHGDRRVARLESDGSFTTIAEFYNWRRFNSPNDVVYKSNGDLYFTDPPYGLVDGVNDSRKELSYQGVYKVTPEGVASLLTADLSRPNGLAFSPDETILYVAVSDPRRAVIMAYDVLADGAIGNGRVFYNATPMVGQKPGLPDGLKVDQQGNLFATGPGGVLVLSPDGELLGTIATGVPTANCAWGNDGSTLYITADMMLCRIRTSTVGAGFPPRTK